MGVRCAPDLSFVVEHTLSCNSYGSAPELRTPAPRAALDASSAPTHQPMAAGSSVFGHTTDFLEAAFSGARDLACVEVFSGAGSIWRAAREAGFATASFDILEDPAQDVCTEGGFLALAQLALRLAPGGLLWVAPMCNSFSWLCLSTTGRSCFNGYAGNPANPNVARGNHVALASVFLMRLALGRGVHGIMENPTGSRLWKFLDQAGAWPFPTYEAVTHRCAFEECPEGGMKLFKRYRLVGTAPWVGQMRRECPCKSRLHRKAAVVVKDRCGKMATSGKRVVLRESGAYPAAMGVAVVQAWKRSLAGRASPSALADSSTLVGLSAAADSSARAGSSAPAGLSDPAGSTAAAGSLAVPGVGARVRSRSRSKSNASGLSIRSTGRSVSRPPSSPALSMD